MEVHAVTLFADLVRAVTACGVTGRAAQAGLISLHTWNPRDFTHDVHRSVDDRAYGGGPGMVMKAQPLLDAVAAARAHAPPGTRVIYLSPQGKPLVQPMLERASRAAGLILVAGRYEGVDERFVEAGVDEEWSLGDYVLSGGELAAMVVIDGVARLLPGVLGHPESAQQDSFAHGLLDHPHYTRPETVAGRSVPPVLLGGDHAAIARWRRREALGRTGDRRPELLARLGLDEADRRLLDEYMQARAQHALGSGETHE